MTASNECESTDDTVSSEGEQDGTLEILRKNRFFRPHRCNTDDDKLQIRRFVNQFILAVGLSIISLIVFGCAYPSFSVEVLGILGIVIESGQKFQEAHYE